MSVEDIKQSLVTLSPTEQSEVTAFLFRLRHASNTDYRELIDARLSDSTSDHWLTPEEFERQLDQG